MENAIKNGTFRAYIKHQSTDYLLIELKSHSVQMLISTITRERQLNIIQKIKNDIFLRSIFANVKPDIEEYIEELNFYIKNGDYIKNSPILSELYNSMIELMDHLQNCNIEKLIMKHILMK